jgi:hypothetical protein
MTNCERLAALQQAARWRYLHDAGDALRWLNVSAWLWREQRRRVTS